MGLLLLRIAVGTIAGLQGAAYFTDPLHLTPASFFAAAAALVSGLGVLVGFLTPITAGLVTSVMLAIGASWLPVAHTLSPLAMTLPSLLVAVMAAALAFLGPGAFSVDARMFGRREIILSKPSRTPGPKSD